MAKLDELKFQLKQYEDSIQILRDRSGDTPLAFMEKPYTGFYGTSTCSTCVPGGAVEQVIRESGWYEQIDLLNKQIKEIEEAPPIFTYNYSSIYGTFTTQAETEPEAYQMFSLWLREKESQVTPEPEPEPEPEQTFDPSTQSGLEQILYTATPVIPEVIAQQQEPEPELAPILQCADVYRWQNGNVSRSTGKFALSQLQSYISQGLMIRQCNTPRPTDQEVKDHYGIIDTSVIQPPGTTQDQPTTDSVTPTVTDTTPDQPTTDSVPPTVTVTAGKTTNFGSVGGILLAGVLALPILAGLGKWR